MAERPSAERVAADVGEVRAAAERLVSCTAELRARPAAQIVAVLGRVGARFLDDADPIRRRALAELPAGANLSPEMAREVLDGMARDWTADRLGRLLDEELGGPEALDGFSGGVGVSGGVADTVSAGERVDARLPAAERSLMAVGPELCVQIVSGSVPGVSVTALLRSLLVKAPTLLKPGHGDELLPALFVEALAEEDAELAEAVAVLYWPGGSMEVEWAALEAAEIVVVYGSDETVGAIRRMARPTTRVVGYHHRVGVGVVGREAGPADAAAEVARAVAMFEQRGCVCPQLIYVEEGGAEPPADFARRVASALEELEGELPSPPPSGEEAGSLHQLRGTAELQAASGAIELHHGGDDAPWTVIYEPAPVAGPGGGVRTVRVRPVEDAARVGDVLAPLGPHLQSVGYAGLGGRVRDVATALGRTGASRVVPFRALSFPPPWWMHDGRGPLGDLLRWVELEGE